MKKQQTHDIDHNAVIRLQNMQKVPQSLFLCFFGALLTIGLSNPGAAAKLMIVFLMILELACMIWWISLYSKIRRIDKKL